MSFYVVDGPAAIAVDDLRSSVAARQANRVFSAVLEALSFRK